MLSVPTPETVAYAQTYGLWIQTGAICLSALAALLLIRWTQKVAARRATLDLLMAEQSEAGLITERREFIKLRDAGHLVQWAAAAQAASTESATIRAALNRYELVAVGIDEGTLDGAIYKRWCRTTLVRDWIACKPFITQLRQTTGTNTYYCEYERLAKKWSKNSEKEQV